ncbi:MAG: hypothetical protein QXZ43_02695 [Candidatus Aenigmatarchaeota archaeon]
MEMKFIIGIIIGLIAIAVLVYFLGISSGLFDNIMNWLNKLIE